MAADPNSILSEVLHRRLLRVATIANEPPWSSIKPDGSLQGYDIDIATLAAQALGVKLSFIRTNVAGRVASLQARKVDITVAAFTPTPSRAITVAFTNPYATDGTRLLVAGNSHFSSPADLNKHNIRIAAGRGSTTNLVVAKQLPKAQVVLLSGDEDALQALAVGQVDAVAANSAIALAAANAKAGTYKFIGPLFGKETDAIGLPSGDFAWWLWLNTFVNTINFDGTNYTLYKKWFGVEPAHFVSPPS